MEIHFDNLAAPGRAITAADLRALFRRTRDNARARGIEFSITQRNVDRLAAVSGGRCQVSGIMFDGSKQYAVNASDRRPFFPSIDRINSSKAYRPGNVRLVCYIVNQAMGTWGDVPFWMMVHLSSKRINAGHGAPA